jgi:hypothetical protein
MCWNWQVSLASFAVISAVGYALFTRGRPNDKLLALFIVSYGSMQLFETFMWWGQTQPWLWLNQLGSVFAALLLYIHLPVLVYGVTIDKAYRGTNPTLIAAAALIAGAVFFYGAYRIADSYIHEKNTFIARPDPISGHLVWESPDNYRLITILAILFFSIFMLPIDPFLFVICLLYFLLPVFFIERFMKVSKENKDKNYLGSYWCWYVAAFSFFFYLAR